MNRVLIVEEDSFQHEILKNAICEKYQNWTVDSTIDFASGKKLLENSINSKIFFSLFLIDVKLSERAEDRNGFVFAEEIRRLPEYYKTPILFLSDFLEGYLYALSEIHCYDYIIKPISKEQILLKLEQMLVTGYLEWNNENSVVIIDTNRIRHKIMVSEIYIIEANNHTLIIQTDNGSIVTREYTMESILKVLGSDFVRCHRGAIVNKKYIDNYDKECQCVQLGKWVIPVGRSYRLNFESVLMGERINDLGVC